MASTPPNPTAPPPWLKPWEKVEMRVSVGGEDPAPFWIPVEVVSLPDPDGTIIVRTWPDKSWTAIEVQIHEHCVGGGLVANFRLPHFELKARVSDRCFGPS